MLILFLKKEKRQLTILRTWINRIKDKLIYLMLNKMLVLMKQEEIL